MKEFPISRKQYIIWFATFAQALIAMLGSLYFSNFGDPVRNIMDGVLFDPTRAFEPCNLCWFARILMYPIVLISLIGIIKKDRHFTDYIFPMALMGIALDTYHYYLQMFPSGTTAFCTLNNPCSALQVNYFDFITIPFLALTAFSIIATLCALNRDINKALEKKA